MKPRRGQPDHEADSVRIEADSISKPEEIYRNSKHNGRRSEIEGKVRIKILRQHPEKTPDGDFRPEKGTVLEGCGKTKMALRQIEWRAISLIL